MLESTTKFLIRFGVIAMVIASLSVLGSEIALAQCVMCKASLTTSNAFARNLNIGVLVLLVPPVSIFCTIFILAIRHRKSG
jgi:hypothetical protein